MFIDDVQWIDSDSLQLLRHMLVRAEPAPILLVLAHRSEDANAISSLEAVIDTVEDVPSFARLRIAVGPLHEDALERLIARHTGASLDAELARSLAREARGSPFFGLELAKVALLRPASRVPPTIEEVLLVRLDTLGPVARELLSVLALAGKPLALGVAAQVIGCSDARSLVDDLTDQRFVRASSQVARAFECYHDRIRHAVLSWLEPARIRELSSRLADALLLSGGDSELLARSLLIAERPQEAAREAVREAARATGQLAFDRAARLYEQAIAHGVFTPIELNALQLGRANALGYAGRGVESAEAYLEASRSAPRDEALALLRRAGEQYLLCGRLERGRELVGAELSALGIGLPRTHSATIASLLWSRTRLRWRGFRFEPKSTHEPLVVRRLECLRAVGHSLVRSDQLRCADVSARHVLMALDHGHALELARGLSTELELSGLMGTPPAVGAEILALADALSTSTADALARQLFHLGRAGHRLWSTRNIPGALEDAERFLELSTMEPQATHSYDRSWAAFHKAYALWLLGRGVEALKLAQVQFEEARSRGDTTIVPAWVYIESCVFPAVGGIERAERDLAAIRSTWRTRDVTAQSVLILGAEYLLAMYRGEPERMWDVTRDHRERLERSLFAKLPLGHSCAAFCCVAAAATAAKLPTGSERSRWLRKMSWYAGRARRSVSTIVPPIAYAIACAQRKPTAAIAALEEALRDPLLPPLFQQASRRRLGVMLGGDTGRSLVSQADAFFVSHGVIDPERYAAMVMPAVEL